MSKVMSEQRSRAAVNEIIPGKLLQRGQIYTWTREVKQERLTTWGVTGVVNFWPKTDAELGELNLDWYLQMSRPQSKGMLDNSIDFMAESVALYLRQDNRTALVLCEAGKTRSVFFCVLVVSWLEKLSLPKSLELVKAKVPGILLKPFMLEFISK